MATQDTKSDPTPSSNTLTNHCAYNTAGIRIAVVYPFAGGFATANYHYGGHPVVTTLEMAKGRVELLNRVAYWETIEVPQ